MGGVMQWLTWLLANYDGIITGVVGILSALIALALIIPGDEPENTLRKWVDFLAKFSRK